MVLATNVGYRELRAGPVLAFLSGNLCYQIEHYLYPDLPSNRYAEIAQRVQAVCATYDLPYTTGPLARQYLLTLRTIFKLALPDRFLTATSDDAPETASEDRFRNVAKRIALVGRGRRQRPATRIGYSNTGPRESAPAHGSGHLAAAHSRSRAAHKVALPGWSDRVSVTAAAVELIDGMDEADVRLIGDGPLFANK